MPQLKEGSRKKNCVFAPAGGWKIVTVDFKCNSPGAYGFSHVNIYNRDGLLWRYQLFHQMTLQSQEVK